VKKKVWIFNHYATAMFFNQGGRHYWFSQNLVKNGYEPIVFCSNIRHNSDDRIEVDKNEKYLTKKVDGIPFTFIKTTIYSKNGLERIKNMISFYKNLFPVAEDYAEKYGKPDVILASSVHPLTLVAGIKIAKKFGIPCICEVRDLWPESIVAYGALKKNSIIAKLLYLGEKWIYKKSNSIIMTWEGSKDYIKDQGWEKEIELSKVQYISNGVVIDAFDRSSEENEICDPDFDNKDYKNIIYAGSIRKVNNLGMLLDSAKIIKNKGIENIRFLIYGSGDESDFLKKRCEEEEITNVLFKGRVEKKFVPSILKKADINILHNSSTSLDKYGQSQNKFFEYLAAGKCIIQTYTTGYSICEKYECGISAPTQNAQEIANAIIVACSDDEKCRVMGENARQAAYDFDFGKLTKKLIDIIEKI
jgi:glycosyltransferase involved in cell wall biosynthesis